MEKIWSLKREREERKEEEKDGEALMLKRQKSYKDIIIDTLLLEEDNEDEPSQDLSSLISTLQEEISSSSSSSSYGPAQPGYCKPEDFSNGPGSGSGSEEEEEEKESCGSVMKHLLQASDDELGLPNSDTSNIILMDDELVGSRQVDGGDYLFDGGEGLWELEDHEFLLAANFNFNYNYHTSLHSSSQMFL